MLFQLSQMLQDVFAIMARLKDDNTNMQNRLNTVENQNKAVSNTLLSIFYKLSNLTKSGEWETTVGESAIVKT